MRSGAPRRRKTAVAATRSVGATTVEQERRGPAHAAHELVGGHRHGADRQRDEHDRRHRDLARVAQQMPRRRLVARGVHERRDEDEEDDVRVELEVGHTRNGPDTEARDDQQRRVRHVDDARDPDKCDSGCHKGQEQLDVVHASECTTPVEIRLRAPQ